MKQFIHEEAERYNVPVKYEGGDPRLVFLDEIGAEMKTIDIKDYNVEEIKKILEDHGFHPVE